jgi:hypothetical protein
MKKTGGQELPKQAEAESADHGRSSLVDVLKAVRRYMLLEKHESAYIAIALAVAVSKALTDEEPLWALVIGPPSSGKTEAVRLLDRLADASVDDLTRAGLLSWHVQKNKARATGLLTKIPSSALVTVSDFSSVVTMGDREARARMFGMLRVVYDGRVRRSIGGEPTSEGAGELEWEGHLTLLAGATPAIDAHTAHEAALGERWLTFRVPIADAARARKRAHFAIARADVAAHRDRARELAADLVRRARSRIPADMSADTSARLVDLAVFIATARTGVTFEGQGRFRVIVDAPTPEEPTRLAQQLVRLARCLVALGVSETDAEALATRAGLDSLPPTREKTLRALLAAGDVGANVSDVHESLGRGNRYAAIWALEELEAVGMVDVEGEPRDENPKAVRIYRLRGEWLAAVREVYEGVASHSLALSIEREQATDAYTSGAETVLAAAERVG